MKKPNLFLTTLILAFALLMVSCNDDDDFKCPDALTGQLNASEADFAGTWIFSGMDADEEIDVTDDNVVNPGKDIFAQYTPCKKDLTYDFKTNRDYALKLGANVADCQKESVTGTWGLTPTNTITFVTGCSTQSVNIEINEEGTEFTYKLNAQLQDVKGSVKIIPVTYTYTKVEAETMPQ